MSKKSRRRNKKILAALALAGGAAMMAKRKKASIADMDDAGIGVTHPALTDTGSNYITKKADTAVAAPKVINKGRTRLSVDGVTPGMVLNARRNVPGYGSAVAPPGILNPYNPRIHTARGMNRAKGGRIGAKKGGRVTGIAKRGFGRALMKGKK